MQLLPLCSGTQYYLTLTFQGTVCIPELALISLSSFHFSMIFLASSSIFLLSLSYTSSKTLSFLSRLLSSYLPLASPTLSDKFYLVSRRKSISLESSGRIGYEDKIDHYLSKCLSYQNFLSSSFCSGCLLRKIPPKFKTSWKDVLFFWLFLSDKMAFLWNVLIAIFYSKEMLAKRASCYWKNYF